MAPPAPRFTYKGGRADRNWKPAARTYALLLYLRNLDDNAKGNNAPTQKINKEIQDAKWIAEENVRRGELIHGVKGNEGAKELVLWINQELDAARTRAANAANEQATNTQAADVAARAAADEDLERLQKLFEATNLDDDWIMAMIEKFHGTSLAPAYGNEKRRVMDFVENWATTWVQTRVRCMTDGLKQWHGDGCAWSREPNQQDTIHMANKRVHEFHILDDAAVGRVEKFRNDQFMTTAPPTARAGIPKVGQLFETFYRVSLDNAEKLSAFSQNAQVPGPGGACAECVC